MFLSSIWNKTFLTLVTLFDLQAVDSSSGPGSTMVAALWRIIDTANQASILWQGSPMGWQQKTAYRWHLSHRPSIGLIRYVIT